MLPQKAITLLQGQIKKAEDLCRSVYISSDDYSSWVLVTKSYLEAVFGVNSPNVSSIASLDRYDSVPMNERESVVG